jgi:hypothetical protein
MGYTSFQHCQTNSNGQFLVGGKLGNYVHSKRAICRFDRGQIFDRYLILVKSEVSQKTTCRKSFDRSAYNNANIRAATDQLKKVPSKV